MGDEVMPADTLRVVRLASPPVARYVDGLLVPEVGHVQTVDVPVTHTAGRYRVADLHGLGEHSVVDTTTGRTDFASTDHSLAVTVADSFHRAGV